MSKAAKKKLKHGTVAKAKKHVSTKPMPWNGDHGTGTEAAMAGTELIHMDGPNRVAQRRKVCVIDGLTSLTLRQHQAAHEIRNAYGQVETLSSGSPIKERVQSSPKPDATIAAQVDAQTRLVRCTRAVLRADRAIVDHICWHNLPVTRLGRMGHPRAMDRFKAAMDKVANSLGY